MNSITLLKQATAQQLSNHFAKESNAKAEAAGEVLGKAMRQFGTGVGHYLLGTGRAGAGVARGLGAGSGGESMGRAAGIAAGVAVPWMVARQTQPGQRFEQAVSRRVGSLFNTPQYYGGY